MLKRAIDALNFNKTITSEVRADICLFFIFTSLYSVSFLWTSMFAWHFISKHLHSRLEARNDEKKTITNFSLQYHISNLSIFVKKPFQATIDIYFEWSLKIILIKLYKISFFVIFMKILNFSLRLLSILLKEILNYIVSKYSFFACMLFYLNLSRLVFC